MSEKMGSCTSINIEELRDLKLFSFKNYVGDNIESYVVDVYDGDTLDIVFEMRGKMTRHKLRLKGYDAPEVKPKKTTLNREIHKRAGILVRDYLREKLIGQKVYLVLDEYNDKYGRLLGELYYDRELTESINQDIIDRGYGKSYGGGTKESFYLEELKTIVEELDN